MNPCMKGWNELQYNSEGRCCCNCVYQRPLVKHPWNEGIFKGSIMTQVIDEDNNPIWVCLAMEAMSMNREHSMCEMHTFKGEHPNDHTIPTETK